MENSTKFFCEHCGVVAEHELIFPVRGNGTIRYISVCSICFTQSIHEVEATNEEIKAVQFVHYLCSCGIHVRGKIVSEKEGNTNYHGKSRKYTEIIAECPRLHCRKKKEIFV